MQKTRTRRRRTILPKLPLTKGQALWISRLIVLVTPLISFSIVEVLNYNNPFTSFTPLQVALNLVWYYLGELFFFFLRGRLTGAAKWSLGFAWGLGMANHYIISFRGRTLFPGDLLTLKTAANVAGNYDYMPDRLQVLCTIAAWGCIVGMCLMPREDRRPWSWKLFVPVTAGTAVYLAIFFGTGFLSAAGITPSMWTTRGNGWLLNFSVCLRYIRAEKPEGYGLEEVKALAGAVQTEESPAAPVRPENLIVIMGESFADLSVLPGVETNQDAMPFFHSLTENAIKGYAYSSVFGGTTANSEYEFLTGNTTAFFPAGTVAYQMYVSDGDPSLVSQVKALGYRAVAMHPYYSSGWNRVPVYTDFGFDEMMFLNDFQDKEYIRGYLSDRSDYENVIRVCQEKEEGEKLFLFNVTMQNHSAYNLPWTGLERTTWLTGALEGRFNTVDQYLSLMYQSDRDLEYLLDYFSRSEEPTMILVFGDHQPQVATNFYSGILGRDPSRAEEQKKQMVPFLLWANYDIPEAQGVETSLNYLSALLAETAGLPLTGYQSFLKETAALLPVVNAVGYRDAGGEWHDSAATMDGETARALWGYQMVQYNNVFDKSDRLENFFGPAA